MFNFEKTIKKLVNTSNKYLGVVGANGFFFQQRVRVSFLVEHDLYYYY